MPKRACKICRRIIEKNICPVCKSADTTASFQGIVTIFDAESEIAKKLGITAPGKYALKI